MTGPTKRMPVLLIEDHERLVRTYKGFLRETSIDLVHAATAKQGLNFLFNDKDSFKAILLDLRLPDMDGFDVLKELDERGLQTPVIVITAHGNPELAEKAIGLGAKDFLDKPFSAERLKVTLSNVIEQSQLKEVITNYQQTIERKRFSGFIGQSLPMQAVYKTIESAAVTKATVFITGESGTGKELAARAIHDNSQRAQHQFIALNCAAIPEDLIESEIFGHVKGAFTGAVRDRPGAARLAHKGTLFLDEIAEMDLRLQSKLLRFLQTGSVTPVGSTKSEEVDVRIVCATNRRPMEEVKAGRFREDLYYRLHVIPILLPPLRERGEDVLLIARHFFKEFSKIEGKEIPVLTAEAASVFVRHSWPGNVRELENLVRRIVVLQTSERVDAGMLEGLIEPSTIPVQDEPQNQSQNAKKTLASQQSLEVLAQKITPLAEVEKRTIEEAIALCGNDVKKAATFLEISPATIYRKIQRWKTELQT